MDGKAFFHFWDLFTKLNLFNRTVDPFASFVCLFKTITTVIVCDAKFAGFSSRLYRVDIASGFRRSFWPFLVFRDYLPLLGKLTNGHSQPSFLHLVFACFWHSVIHCGQAGLREIFALEVRIFT